MVEPEPSRFAGLDRELIPHVAHSGGTFEASKRHRRPAALVLTCVLPRRLEAGARDLALVPVRAVDARQAVVIPLTDAGAVVARVAVRPDDSGGCVRSE